MIATTVAAAVLAVPLTVAPSGDCWDTANRCHALAALKAGMDTTLLADGPSAWPLAPEWDQDKDLQQDAKGWARHMADAGAISHARPSGAFPYGENVGVGPDWETVFAAFVGSPAHLANIRDPDFTQVGIGSAWAQGRIYIVIRFH